MWLFASSSCASSVQHAMCNMQRTTYNQACTVLAIAPHDTTHACDANSSGVCGQARSARRFCAHAAQPGEIDSIPRRGSVAQAGHAWSMMCRRFVRSTWSRDTCRTTPHREVEPGQCRAGPVPSRVNASLRRHPRTAPHRPQCMARRLELGARRRCALRCAEARHVARSIACIKSSSARSEAALATAVALSSDACHCSHAKRVSASACSAAPRCDAHRGAF